MDTKSSGTIFQEFSIEEWSKLRGSVGLTLSESQLAMLRSTEDHLSLGDVVEAYLPLSRFLSLHMHALAGLHIARDAFLGRRSDSVPFVIAVSGSVAVGKSTFARVLQFLIGQWPEKPTVALVTTDGFLYPNAVLEQRGLMKKKGFPESYDLPRMIRFLAEIKAGLEEVEAPRYSHLVYDIVPNEAQRVKRPDILIFEGLNVLQTPHGASILASDFFDFSIYLDAEETDIEKWYVDRFLLLQHSAFRDPESYFYRYRHLSREEAIAMALSIWKDINLPNLYENILPTRQRADLVLRKSAHHRIQSIWLRKT
jgi:type I pantothenate kinase